MYRAIETSLWDDPKVRGLDSTAKLAFVYLLTNRYTHVSGIYVLSPVLPPHETGIPSPKWDTLWHTLSGVGLARIDPKTDVIWVVKMFRHQGRGEKNQRSAAKHLATLHNSFLLRDFLLEYPLVKPFVEPSIIDRVSDRVSQVRLQEQEQEKEKEQKKEQENKEETPATPTSLSRSASRNGDIERVFSHFRAIHPRARLTKKRKTLIGGHLRDGYTVDDLTLALDGLHLDKWHNDTGNLTLEYGLRNADKIEQLQAVASDPSHPKRIGGGPVLSDASKRAIEAGNSFLRRHANET